MAAFITSGPVQVVAVALLGTGVLLLAGGNRSRRFPGPIVGAGALLATLGAATCWVAFFIFPSDGPSGWVSVPDIYFALFASWSYVFMFAFAAAGLWIVIDRLASHHWSISSMRGILVGSLVASVTLGLLDPAISPLG